ncbi:MAG: ABC transporter transmembrane domain-containing protein [Corynebacterium sp.]|uniref:ABC transporter transmembrane domain-containing protein n=1 Tax=unclassified Corynebacterium TaxID=2624378 RepID=UPI002648AD7F|nr:ABC transporter ATP-binding protein [Corynebacterium sp.]MDN5581422.1 ABC transporter ATP-binding protein/permease [Corynebacterium sp.]MDN5718561.1 ABC transporter ATP-binding protein/permease [Corynebacterium sp.]MDN6324430.1 ABC transporter ATP-binding protein/permease [Corynebacterium sp.]
MRTTDPSGDPTAAPSGVTTGHVLRIALTGDGRARRLAACTLGLVVHNLGDAAVPVLIGVIIDRAVMPGDPRALAVWLGALAGVFLLTSLSYQRAMLGMVRVYGHGEHDLRQLALGRVLHPRGHARRSTGEVLSITTNDTFQVAGVSWSIVQQLATVAGLVAAAGALLAVSAPLGIGVLAGAVAVLVLMQRLSRPMFARGRTEQRAVAAASDVAADAMAGLRTIRGLGAEDEVARRYRVASAHSRDTAVASALSLRGYEAVSDVVSLVYLAVLTFAAGWLALDGTITPGELVTVIGLAQYLKGSLSHIGTFGANWAYKRASAARLRAFVAEEYQLPGAAHPAPRRSGDAGVLTWEATADASAATAPTVTARAGRLVGVHVATSDAGRIADRLGFRTVPARGELTLDGVDALDLGPDAWHRAVTVPPRDSTLFTGSLRENVTFSDAQVDADVATATALDDVVTHLGSVEAPVGEGGHRLSGGQRRRAVLARALHASGHVLVLDEPTMSLDPVTARDVATGLAALVHDRPGLAVLVITSDHLMLDACDEVVEL